MRLLHATTLEFKIFHDDQIPPYLILSHTWGSEEVSYQEMRFLQQYYSLPETLRNNKIFVATLKAAAGLDVSSAESKPIKQRSGYTKIVKMAELSREKNLENFWIDTCCIDKSSSAELQEAINSMFRWYQHSDLCIVHLEHCHDLERRSAAGLDIVYFLKALTGSRWITRGWTLQELIAPRFVDFYSASWVRIGDKENYLQQVAHATKIPDKILKARNLEEASVAQKMSWAANRKTTRKEDMAHSLMGLFGIHMPMLYGEGENAFRRLQEEIIRTTPDDSIFAWEASARPTPFYSGLLANSPMDFAKSAAVTKGHGVFAISNLGLRMDARMTEATEQQMQGFRDKLVFVCMLGAKQDENRIGLLVRRLALSSYTRIQVCTFCGPSGHLQPITAYFEQMPKIPSGFVSLAMRCFYLRFTYLGREYTQEHFVSNVRPYWLWDSEEQEILIPDYSSSGPDRDIINLRTTDRKTEDHFVFVVWLNSLLCSSRQVLLRYSFVSGEVRYTILPNAAIAGSLPAYNSPTTEWHRAIQTLEDRAHRRTADQHDDLKVVVSPGLHRGKLAYIVEIQIPEKRTFNSRC